MFGTVRILLLALPLSLVAGLALGHSTVAAMQVRASRRVVVGDETAVSDRAFERGMRWAHEHRLLRPDDCPAPDQYFLSGCVSASGS